MDKDLCSISINDFRPIYLKSYSENNVSLPENKSLKDFISDIFLAIPDNQQQPKNTYSLKDVKVLAFYAKKYMIEKKTHLAKHILKSLPFMIVKLHSENRANFFENSLNFFNNSTLDEILNVLLQIYEMYPEKRCVMLPIVVLEIVQHNITNVLFDHITTIPKDIIKEIFIALMNKKTPKMHKIFVMSTFVPSIHYDVLASVNVTKKPEFYLLPDPIDMAKYINDFDENEIAYACHVMQLCHHFIFSISQKEKTEINDFFPYLNIIGTSTFSKSCFSRALHVLSLNPNTNDIFTNFIQKLCKTCCPIFVEQLILYNVSESFCSLIPLLGNIFYQYFLSNFDILTEEMKKLTFVYCYDLLESATHISSVSYHNGNRLFLYWFYSFFVRFSTVNDDIKIKIIRDYGIVLMKKIYDISLLIKSSEHFFDPSIDSLVASTIIYLYNFLRYIVKAGSFTSNSLINIIYNLSFQALHFLISAPVKNTPTFLGCEFIKAYNSIKLLIEKQPLIFKRCIFLSKYIFNYPVISLALTGINIPLAFLKKLCNLLILSDEQTCFYSLSSLMCGFKVSNKFTDFLINFLYNIVYIDSPRDINLQIRILSRYFLLLSSIFSKNDKMFAYYFLKSDQFDAFAELTFKLSIESLKNLHAIVLQESIIFALHSLYLSAFQTNLYNEIEFEPFTIDYFFENIDLYSKKCVISLLQLCINWCKVHKFNELPFSIPWDTLLKSQSLNEIMRNTIDEIKNNLSDSNSSTNNEDESVTPTYQVFLIPWKQNRLYSKLLEFSTWNSKFKTKEISKT